MRGFLQIGSHMTCHVTSVITSINRLVDCNPALCVQTLNIQVLIAKAVSM